MLEGVSVGWRTGRCSTRSRYRTLTKQSHVSPTGRSLTQSCPSERIGSLRSSARVTLFQNDQNWRDGRHPGATIDRWSIDGDQVTRLKQLDASSAASGGLSTEVTSRRGERRSARTSDRPIGLRHGVLSRAGNSSARELVRRVDSAICRDVRARNQMGRLDRERPVFSAQIDV